jgi:hypothetical protein
MNTNIIYKTIVGSQMHGLATPNSDEDIRYITKGSIRDLLSPFKNDEVKVKDGNGEDVESWDLRFFVKHLCSGNATIFEVIKSPLYDKRLEHSEAIRSLMPYCFDAKKILMAHIGYAEAQLKRYLRKANEDFISFNSNTNNLKLTSVNFYHTPEEIEKYISQYSSKSVECLTNIWEENQIRRIPKSVIAGYRVLAQARQLLETGDFQPVIKDYSPELHDKLMRIKTMDPNTITCGFIVEHLEGVENGIKELKSFYETLPDEIKNKKPDIQAIEDTLCEIYGVN